jgi:hypothetical protein
METTAFRKILFCLILISALNLVFHYNVYLMLDRVHQHTDGARTTLEVAQMWDLRTLSDVGGLQRRIEVLEQKLSKVVAEKQKVDSVRSRSR